MGVWVTVKGWFSSVGGMVAEKAWLKVCATIQPLAFSVCLILGGVSILMAAFGYEKGVRNTWLSLLAYILIRIIFN